MQGHGKLVKASGGDLILWDSRTVHGGLVGTGPPEEMSTADVENTIELVRLSLPVCMAPTNLAN